MTSTVQSDQLPVTYDPSIRKSNHPSTTFFHLHLVFPQSKPSVSTQLTAPTSPPPQTSFPLDNATVQALLSAAISQFYGQVGQSTISYHLYKVNPISATVTVGVDNFAANAFRTAMTSCCQFRDAPLTIMILQQGSTLDQLSLASPWYNDLLD